MTNIYANNAISALPRVLALFDENPVSKTQGVGDRYFWSWKGRDFANGTFQGAVHGLSCLMVKGLLPKSMHEQRMLERINYIIRGTRSITRHDGSLDEILPFEQSFCVTALVAFDILSALALLNEKLTQKEMDDHLATVEPLINYILNNSEGHGVISNHLAAAIAALVKWQQLTTVNVSNRVSQLTADLFEGYSPEGWFYEYSGADFGYQTLTLDYLADLDFINQNTKFSHHLKKAIQFLSYGALPNGSFGGTFGSRNTRFLYPAGVELLALKFSEAVPLARFCRQAHKRNSVVSLACLDEPNFITMFNSFCRAALTHAPLADRGKLPFQSKQFLKHLPEAGLTISKIKNNYTVVNWKKGGCFSSSLTGENFGVVAKNKKTGLFASQISNKGKLIYTKDYKVLIESNLIPFEIIYPSVLKFLLLRLLCISLMRNRHFNIFVKRVLVKLLVLREKKGVAVARREINLKDSSYHDYWVENPRLLEFTCVPKFYATHMASQGYWQLSDDQ